ncbi:MAG: hypothetical protein UV69_C0026G0001, partial [Parcubacteria group bacterium GW2011_GWE2_43_12]
MVGRCALDAVIMVRIHVPQLWRELTSRHRPTIREKDVRLGRIIMVRIHVPQ